MEKTIVTGNTQIIDTKLIDHTEYRFSLKPIAKAISLSLISLSMAHNVATQAATIEVTSNLDDGTGCTLREAIVSTNNRSLETGCVNVGDSFDGVLFNDNTITFSNSGLSAPNNTITLNNGVLNIGAFLNPNYDSLLIDGNSISEGITIDANQQSNVFKVIGSSITLNNMIITGGNSLDSAIDLYSMAFGTLNACTVTNNTATGGNAGGIHIHAVSSLTLRDSIVSNNIGVNGGGISNSIYASYSSGGSFLRIYDSLIEGNTATGNGGGIFSYAKTESLVLNNSVVENNIANSSGGGIFLRKSTSSGPGVSLPFAGSIISNNTASEYGGGMFLTSDAAIDDVVITNNFAGRNGGGVFIDADIGGKTNLSDITLSGNSAGRFGGGFAISRDFLRLTIEDSVITSNSAAFGGGFDFNSGDLDLVNSTVSNNSAVSGGGFHSNENTYISIAGSTISGNSAENGGGFFKVNGLIDIENSTLSNNFANNTGGALYVQESGIGLSHTTISNNSANVRAGGIHLGIGMSSFSLQNSIIANSDGRDCIIFSDVEVESDTSSIIEDGSCFTNAREVNPGLLPLADNGGPTMTHALLEGSRARNQASRLNCPELDQRGEVREFRDGFCDVGAYEFFEEFVPSEETFYVIPLGDGKSVTIPL